MGQFSTLLPKLDLKTHKNLRTHKNIKITCNIRKSMQSCTRKISYFTVCRWFKAIEYNTAQEYLALLIR